MTIENSAYGVKEQKTIKKRLSRAELRKQKFNSLLDARAYSSALELAEKIPSPHVCSYVSRYIDRLIPLKEVSEARKVARLFGRNLDVYLLRVHGINGRDKPYKAGRRN